MNFFPLQDAKARLSYIIKKAMLDGPLGISVRGKKEVVLLSKKEYDILVGYKPSFVEFMANSPLKGISLRLERDRSISREIDL